MRALDERGGTSGQVSRSTCEAVGSSLAPGGGDEAVAVAASDHLTMQLGRQFGGEVRVHECQRTTANDSLQAILCTVFFAIR
jgi:hypothetical protein